MIIDRREFIKTGLIAGAGLQLSACSRIEENSVLNERYKQLDSIVNQPFLKSELFKDPVILDTIDLLEYQGNYICRVRSKGGSEGFSISNNMQMQYLYPIMIKRVIPFFIGKDARFLDQLLNELYVYKSNYKLQSLALWVPIATIEFAILDLLGRIVKKPMCELISNTYLKEIAVYRANNYRGTSAEESLIKIKKNFDETGAKAVKFKIGGRMSDSDEPPGRTEKLIKLIRENFDENVTIYADANGGYDVENAVRVGKLLEKNAFHFFEEPVPFDRYQDTKTVNDALNIPIAGGEQEPSINNFRWLIANNALDIVQPDIFYFGGMIRSLKVAMMAHSMGMKCVPHISGSGLGYLYMMHFVSILPNAGEFHEFKGFTGDIPFYCETSDLKIKDGKIKVPSGPGSGIDIDPDFIVKHKRLELL
jgi:L-alanine-DL-glutamate epimerase-like enolase superfamily enzyme